MALLIVSTLVVLVVVTIFAVVRLAWWRAERRAEAWERHWQRIEPQLADQWWRTQHRLRSSPGACLIVVESNYQRAKRGTKSWVRWSATGTRQDTWFAEMEWPAGTWLVVSPSIGWGPHNHNPRVLYLTRSHILEQADARAPQAAESFDRRQRSSR